MLKAVPQKFLWGLHSIVPTCPLSREKGESKRLLVSVSIAIANRSGPRPEKGHRQDFSQEAS
jgi:hypothetical protein